MLVAIFDIDGVLADNTLTRHLDCAKPSQDAEFKRLIPNLAPLGAAILPKILKKQQIPVFIFTARSYATYKATEEWLKNNDIPYDDLFMRKLGNNDPAYVLKGEMLDKVFEKLKLKFTDQIIAFEDNPETATMFALEGVSVFRPYELRQSKFLKNFSRAK